MRAGTHRSQHTLYPGSYIRARLEDVVGVIERGGFGVFGVLQQPNR